MSAVLTPPVPVSAAVPPTAPSAGGLLTRMKRFTLDEYHRLIQTGAIGRKDRIVLLEGYLVKQMSHNPPHVVALNRLRKLLDRLLPVGWDSRIQGPVTLPSSTSEPEPDYAIIRGSDADYEARHPGPADLGLVVEVADSSLHDDRTDSQRIYARAGIAEYWIVNIPDRQVEVYTDPQPTADPPRYTTRTDYPTGTSVPVTLDDIAVGTINVSDVLP